jgi:glycogen phosphorylase
MSGPKKDPVCGMTVLSERGLTASYRDQTIYFCSEYCRDKFAERPERHLAALVGPGYDEAKEHRRVAYFSMEVAVGASMPTYSGGLGVLAGDTLKSCADLRVPVVGVTLLYRKGYFDQTFDRWGGQQERPVDWNPAHFLKPLTEMVRVEIGRRAVQIRAWRYDVVGMGGYVVPLILLDTDVDGNADGDRSLTDYLYGGDDRYRLAQEVVLGIGGVRMLRALGYTGIGKFHMNEGHAALLVLELLKSRGEAGPAEMDFEGARNRCVFTTHTPVPAGHDRFDYDLVLRVLPETVPFEVLRMLGGEDRLNMTLLGLNLSRYVNGVARRHEEVSREMFPGYPIGHVTNGVHSWTWTSDSFRVLYDRHVPGWANDPAMLRQAVTIPGGEAWAAHAEAKGRLLSLVRERTGVALAADALTVGFARRAAAYKRAELVFAQPNRLLEIAGRVGPLQFVFAGKAHPKDYDGKEVIRRVVAAARRLGGGVPVVYLENYDMEMARLIAAGADLWLNTPRRPLEASGTSGMKAAHNGVPSLSVLDGWWVEGHVEGLTGWSIGPREAGPAGDSERADLCDADDLYRKLEGEIAPAYYRDRGRWVEIMRHAVALNASYFNTHRMVQQYVTNAYLP